jgi:N-acetyllactosaminide beta-1,6-N-acetylglucosaminyltransferase
MRNIYESTTLKFKHKNLNPNWKYLINTASTEFPLRTNYEMTRILHMYNGTNEIEIIKKFNKRRIDIEWHVVVTTNDGGEGGYVLKATNKTKSPPPHKFRIVKGSAYGMFSRAFVEYALTSSHVRDLLEWGKDTWSPDEWLWATLQFNTQFKPPGGFKGTFCDS